MDTVLAAVRFLDTHGMVDHIHYGGQLATVNFTTILDGRLTGFLITRELHEGPAEGLNVDEEVIVL